MLRHWDGPAAHALETVAAGNEIGLNKGLPKAGLWLGAVQVGQGSVRLFPIEGLAACLAGFDQIQGDLGLAVDQNLVASDLGDGNFKPIAVEKQAQALVGDMFALQALGTTRLLQGFSRVPRSKIPARMRPRTCARLARSKIRL